MKRELTKLIESAMKGDKDAAGQLMEQEAKHIFYICLKLMGNSADAEDAAQEAMLRIYSHIGELKSAYAFQTWLYQIVTRTCFNMKKKRLHNEWDYLETEDELTEERRDFLPQDYIEDVDKRDFLMKIITELPERYQLSLLLFYFEGMSYQEIAEVMETTEKAVDSVLQRARQRIKKQMDKKYGGEITYASFQGVATTAVLTQAFQLEAAAAATPEVLGRIVSGFWQGVGAGGAAAGTGTAAGTASTTGVSGTTSTAAATTFKGGLTTKAIIGLTVAATATGGALAVFPSNGVEARQSEPLVVQEEMTIRTLEDMIGEGEAQTLRAYAAGAEDESGWAEFLAALSVGKLSGGFLEDIQYTLYRLEKQDKQLLIVEQCQEAGGLQVAFRFTDCSEEIPTGTELLKSLERWQ